MYFHKQLTLSKIVNRRRDALHAKAMQLWPPRAGGASLSKSRRLWAIGSLEEEEGQTRREHNEWKANARVSLQSKHSTRATLTEHTAPTGYTAHTTQTQHTQHTQHKQHTQHTQHTRLTQHTQHTPHSQRTLHAQNKGHTQHAQHTRHTQHTHSFLHDRSPRLDMFELPPRLTKQVNCL